jgi:hypothetical protein
VITFYSTPLLPLKFFIKVLLLRANLTGFAKLYINHKDHEEHKGSNIIIKISFVIFVYFVVNLYHVGIDSLWATTPKPRSDC